MPACFLFQSVKLRHPAQRLLHVPFALGGLHPRLDLGHLATPKIFIQAAQARLGLC